MSLSTDALSEILRVAVSQTARMFYKASRIPNLEVEARLMLRDRFGQFGDLSKELFDTLHQIIKHDKSYSAVTEMKVQQNFHKNSTFRQSLVETKDKDKPKHVVCIDKLLLDDMLFDVPERQVGFRVLCKEERPTEYREGVLDKVRLKHMFMYRKDNVMLSFSTVRTGSSSDLAQKALCTHEIELEFVQPKTKPITTTRDKDSLPKDLDLARQRAGQFLSQVLALVGANGSISIKRIG